MRRATTGEPIPLQVVLPDGNETYYVVATVFSGDTTDTTVTTLILQHRLKGVYSVDWVASVEGYYTVVYDVYTDSSATKSAGYDRDGELVEVTSDKSNISRLLGLQHENSIVDQQTYSNTGKLLTARVRAYETAADAEAAGIEGLRYTWAVQATYNTADQLISYRILRSAT